MIKKLEIAIERFVKNTPRKGYVKDLKIKVCEIPNKIRSKIKSKDSRVYVTTKSLKHMYDARSAQEFDFITKNLEKIISKPSGIYKNKENKTGDYCFYCEFGKDAFFCILQIESNGIYIVSSYRLSKVEEKKKNYLSGYKLLWSWKVDLPSS